MIKIYLFPIFFRTKTVIRIKLYRQRVHLNITKKKKIQNSFDLITYTITNYNIMSLLLSENN